MTLAANALLVTSRAAYVEHPGRAELAGVGEEFLESAKWQWRSGPLQRGRSYARGGYLLELHRDDEAGSVSAAVRGSGAKYRTSIHGIPSRGPFQPAASCTCPYGSVRGDWCKHAIALAFAVSALLDGRVADETGLLVDDPELDRDELVRAAAVLLDRPDSLDRAFDPDAHFVEATRWLAFPPLSPDR